MSEVEGGKSEINPLLKGIHAKQLIKQAHTYKEANNTDKQSKYIFDNSKHVT